jgi:hypothetical protein
MRGYIKWFCDGEELNGAMVLVKVKKAGGVLAQEGEPLAQRETPTESRTFQVNELLHT